MPELITIIGRDCTYRDKKVIHLSIHYQYLTVYLPFKTHARRGDVEGTSAAARQMSGTAVTTDVRSLKSNMDIISESQNPLSQILGSC